MNYLDKLSIADLVKLREILLDVIDSDRWQFDEGWFDPLFEVNGAYLDEDGANRNRMNFCDEVQRRIVKLAAPQAVNAHDPDHWNVEKGGNRASDDYWS